MDVSIKVVKIQKRADELSLSWPLDESLTDAEFEQPDASIAAVDYGHNRKINRHLIERLATCEYITEYRNIFITGATGSGKTYLACAFGMEACKRYYSVKYVRLLFPVSGKETGRRIHLQRNFENASENELETS